MRAGRWQARGGADEVRLVLASLGAGRETRASMDAEVVVVEEERDVASERFRYVNGVSRGGVRLQPRRGEEVRGGDAVAVTSGGVGDDRLGE